MAKDKRLHFIAGMALSLVAGLFVWPLLPPLPWWLRWLVMWSRPGLGLWAAAMGGAVKELIWDWWWQRGTPEWWDFWATCIGGIVGAVLITFC